MKACLTTLCMALCLTCATSLNVGAQTGDPGRRFDAPAPKAARALVKRGTDLAGRDRIDEAAAALKKAIAAAPDFLEAHLEYIRLKANFPGRAAA